MAKTSKHRMTWLGDSETNSQPVAAENQGGKNMQDGQSDPELAKICAPTQFQIDRSNKRLIELERQWRAERAEAFKPENRRSRSELDQIRAPSSEGSIRAQQVSIIQPRPDHLIWQERHWRMHRQVAVAGDGFMGSHRSAEVPVHFKQAYYVFLGLLVLGFIAVLWGMHQGVKLENPHGQTVAFLCFSALMLKMLSTLRVARPVDQSESLVARFFDWLAQVWGASS